MERDKHSKLKAKGRKDGKPRYSEGTFPAYDKTYNRLKDKSHVLNERPKQSAQESYTPVDTVQNCKINLYQLNGGNAGKFKKGKTTYVARIPSAEKQLQEVYNEYGHWQNEKVESGETLTKPTEWPKKLVPKRVKAEAVLDIYHRERAFLKDKINRLREEKGELHAQEVLQYGLYDDFTKNLRQQQDYVNATNPARRPKVAGQYVAWYRGRPYINDEASPYNGMSYYHFKQLEEQWLAEHGLADKGGHQIKNDAKHDRLPGPETYPDWPDDVKPIKEIEFETED